MENTHSKNIKVDCLRNTSTELMDPMIAANTQQSIMAKRVQAAAEEDAVSATADQQRMRQVCAKAESSCCCCYLFYCFGINN